MEVLAVRSGAGYEASRTERAGQTENTREELNTEADHAGVLPNSLSAPRQARSAAANVSALRLRCRHATEERMPQLTYK